MNEIQRIYVYILYYIHTLTTEFAAEHGPLGLANSTQSIILAQHVTHRIGNLTEPIPYRLDGDLITSAIFLVQSHKMLHHVSPSIPQIELLLISSPTSHLRRHPHGSLLPLPLPLLQPGLRLPSQRSLVLPSLLSVPCVPRPRPRPRRLSFRR